CPHAREVLAERLTVKPVLAAATSRRRFSMATGSAPGTGLWGEAIAFLPVLAATSSWRSPPSITGSYPGRTSQFRGEGGKVRKRRISLVAAHSGDRLLSEPTAGTQPCWGEPLFMPLSRHP